MKKAGIKLILAPLLGVVLAGCSVPRSDSAVSNRVSLDYSSAGYSVIRAPMGSVTISKAQTYQDGENFIVSGQVRMMHEIQLPGHVDLAICASEGTLLAQDTTRVPGLVSKRGGAQELPFRFQLPLSPPEGAIIRLQYHAPASETGELGCQKT